VGLCCPAPKTPRRQAQRASSLVCGPRGTLLCSEARRPVVCKQVWVDHGVLVNDVAHCQGAGGPACRCHDGLPPRPRHKRAEGSRQPAREAGLVSAPSPAPPADTSPRHRHTGRRSVHCKDNKRSTAATNGSGDARASQSSLCRASSGLEPGPNVLVCVPNRASHCILSFLTCRAPAAPEPSRHR
jgi:hypothetical protein